MRRQDDQAPWAEDVREGTLTHVSLVCGLPHERFAAASAFTTTLPSSHPVRRRPTHRGAGVVHGVQVERATVRTTCTPWAASARLCLGRRCAGWEPPRTPLRTRGWERRPLHPGAGRSILLCNRPHQMDGATRFAKAGRDRSRYAADSAEEQTETWYTMNATEIAVLHLPPGHNPSTYALTTARLCDHFLAYAHRTRMPLPAHAAMQMDKNHPDCRRTIDWDSEEEL
ncbi:RNaseH domain-containing protein [Streptomyces sp. NPDC057557]|uniref:RNaseH domain-containing protein n=1 Tax=Streptomyces sp. NPDC057557 TaxID=3346167 RepID=UPI0036AC15AE